jgi:ribosomal protein S13
MKKILLLFLTTTLFITTAFAAINTHDQLVEEYLEVSGQQEAFAKVPTQMVNMLEQQFATAQQSDPQLLNSMKKGLTKKETVAKLTENIRKLSSEDLSKLIAFYKTEIGQKCAKLNKEEDMETMERELPSFLQNLQTNPPSRHRIESMNTMFTKTNVLPGTLKMVDAIVRIYNASLPKEKQMKEEEIEGMMMQASQLISQQLILSFYYSLRNLSDSEVEKIVQVTLTPEGEAETDAQLAGVEAYISTAATDLVATVSRH